jgi:hypothetical protein
VGGTRTHILPITNRVLFALSRTIQFSYHRKSCPVLVTPERGKFYSGARPRYSQPRMAGELSNWNPSGSDRRDPNTLAPNKIKARATPLHPSRTSTSSIIKY